MPTEFDVARAIESKCFLFVVELLERSDFTSISQVSSRALRAKDGSRDVYVWIDYHTDPESKGIAIPNLLVKLAAHDRARIDVVRIDITEDNEGRMRHYMNAVPRP